jgi:hypothetical protein
MNGLAKIESQYENRFFSTCDMRQRRNRVFLLEFKSCEE